MMVIPSFICIKKSVYGRDMSEWITIKPEDFSDALSDTLQLYSDRLTREVKDAVSDAGNYALREVRAIAPTGKGKSRRRGKSRAHGKYRKSLELSVVKDDIFSREVKIYSKTEYQLVHLLEKGHNIVRGGKVVGQTSPHPHMKVVELRAQSKLNHDVERIIKDES